MNFLSFLISKRLYHRNNKNYAVLLTSILSKIGISISIFTLVLSFSALNGFQILIKKNILSALPHGIIELTDQSLLNWKDVTKKLKLLPEVIYSEPYILMNSILLKNDQIRFINIKSFKNVEYIKKYFSFQKKLFNFSKLKKICNNEIIISSDLAEYFSLKEGDLITLIILNKKINFEKNKIKNFSFKIKSIFHSNGISNSNIGLIPFIFFQKVFKIDNDVDKIELYMSDPFQADKIILKIAEKTKIPLFFYSWMYSYKYIYHDIKIIKTIIYLTLFLIILISCFSLISISLTTISKKTKEIAILRSIGANNILIQLIFFYYGMRFIFIGNLIGLLTGIITVLNFKKIMLFLENNFSESWLLQNVYYKNFLLLKLNLFDLIIIFISTLIIGIIANWYPIYYASKINPNEILREY
ncbi:FtsX-like permease family protein [Buchnera aphidicola]|uniref:FtsX-like permease family protein n=1 Tax=Buchnera aphidicola subsp. Rhopalosiphum maidis TaxID=118109 RepID=A0A3G2I661_BUCRM|nr:FtsX-like permease family protein [Buchnera aphidicola]AYN24769.1 FtsX-like permease family protein [Buchnera aphidicola (Rhopalosiphum maidis)]